MGWFKNLANKARASNKAASEKLFTSSSSSYESVDEVCSNCKYYLGSTGGIFGSPYHCCKYHNVDLDPENLETHGCDNFWPN